MPYLPAIEIEPAQPATAAVIWLHGLGADGNDFAPIVPELRLPESLAVRFIFPHAPSIPVTINNGWVMPAWYDILEMTLDRRIDETQLRASAAEIRKLIEREIERGIDSRRILLAGFSQGGAVAYETALSFDKPLGGLLAMSTYYATADSIELNEANRQLPVLVQHGTLDPVVPESLGQKALQRLQADEFEVSYQSYPMEHAVCPPQIEAIADWIRTRLD
ncbi:carboxylesterase [Motiliproteus coralliicola]|uniref:Carboxylesterase n=1 Tax=Motiliproteus coralliicola TaxID=2283196 RepID=A0A369WBJ8_9GAMM|nr:dienelactone hydrolase family protein [Motiliproteus coralliicola]RDE19037.1 carboxylesterase [Motiliproteus coralliicola]